MPVPYSVWTLYTTVWTPILMSLGEFEIGAEAAIKVAEGGGVEHALEEVLTGGVTTAAGKGAVTARELIAQAVEKGQIPKSLYAGSERFAGLTNPRTVTVENQFISNDRFFVRREAAQRRRVQTAGCLYTRRKGRIIRQQSLLCQRAISPQRQKRKSHSFRRQQAFHR